MSVLISVLTEVESKGVKLVPNGDKLDIVGPGDALTDDLIQELKAHKEEILRALSPNLHGCSMDELIELAGDEWPEIKDDPKGIECFARMIATRMTRERGEVPDHYTGTTNCQRCGVVPIWGNAPKEVLSCVWCFNRISGSPMSC